MRAKWVFLSVCFAACVCIPAQAAAPVLSAPSAADIASARFRGTFVELVRSEPKLLFVTVVFHDANGASRVVTANRAHLNPNDIFDDSVDAIRYAQAHADDVSKEELPAARPVSADITL